MSNDNRTAEQHECIFYLVTDIAVHSCECGELTVSDNNSVKVYVPIEKFNESQSTISRLESENRELKDMVKWYQNNIRKDKEVKS